jgi:hypothetical protein
MNLSLITTRKPLVIRMWGKKAKMGIAVFPSQETRPFLRKIKNHFATKFQ